MEIELWENNQDFLIFFLLWEMDKITKTDILNMEIVQRGN